MRKLMQQEALKAKERGETIDEKTTSEEEDEMSEGDLLFRNEMPKNSSNMNNGSSEFINPNRPLRNPELSNSEIDEGHEADMDDTSMSSRASSRLMGESMEGSGM
jgi:hypothetical protein